MNNDDLDALAAEYVLGTLASDERANAEALIATDPGFAETVRQWERRLGELNVMVEAVEPPPELWNKIKSGIGGAAASDQPSLAPVEPATAPMAAPAQAAATTAPKSEPESRSGGLGLIGAPAGSLLPPEEQATAEPEAKPEPKAEPKPEPRISAGYPPQRATPATERSADVVYLARRARRWRAVAVMTGAIAAALAALIVVSQVDPALIPAGGFHIPQFLAQGPAPQAPAAAPGSRLVAVLQQEPSAPAFLLTIDPASKTLTMRRVAAKEEAGHSYELWLIASSSAKPVALGVVGAGEYTQQPLPADIDADAVRGATYAVSFEPEGGSKTGAPTGPILFTGRLVESAPPPAAPASKT